MQIVYVEHSTVYIAVDANLNIVGAQRAPRRKPVNSHAVKVADMRATAHGEPNLNGSTFTTDGLGCIRLLYWIALERPNASLATQRRRFYALFHDDSATEPLRAAARIYGGQEHRAQGETKFFIQHLYRQHPVEMQAIAMLGRLHSRLRL